MSKKIIITITAIIIIIATLLIFQRKQITSTSVDTSTTNHPKLNDQTTSKFDNDVYLSPKEYPGLSCKNSDSTIFYLRNETINMVLPCEYSVTFVPNNPGNYFITMLPSKNLFSFGNIKFSNKYTVPAIASPCIEFCELEKAVTNTYSDYIALEKAWYNNKLPNNMRSIEINSRKFYVKKDKYLGDETLWRYITFIDYPNNEYKRQNRIDVWVIGPDKSKNESADAFMRNIKFLF